jgi:hypothetical protein
MFVRAFGHHGGSHVGFLDWSLDSIIVFRWPGPKHDHRRDYMDELRILVSFHIHI